MEMKNAAIKWFDFCSTLLSSLKLSPFWATHKNIYWTIRIRIFPERINWHTKTVINTNIYLLDAGPPGAHTNKHWCHNGVCTGAIQIIWDHLWLINCESPTYWSLQLCFYADSPYSRILCVAEWSKYYYYSYNFLSSYLRYHKSKVKQCALQFQE